jgi:peptidyl-dipeptidase Dcp
MFKASWYRAEKNDDGITRDVIEQMANYTFAKRLMGKVLPDGSCKIKWHNPPAPAMDLLAKVLHRLLLKLK